VWLGRARLGGRRHGEDVAYPLVILVHEPPFPPPLGQTGKTFRPPLCQAVIPCRVEPINGPTNWCLSYCLHDAAAIKLYYFNSRA